MLEIFRDGGYGMFPTAIAGLLLLGVAARYAVKPDARFVPLQVALAITTLSIGAASFVTGLSVTAKALPGVHDEAALVGAVGFGESLNNIALALTLIALASIATTVGAARLTRLTSGVSGGAST